MLPYSNATLLKIESAPAGGTPVDEFQQLAADAEAATVKWEGRTDCYLPPAKTIRSTQQGRLDVYKERKAYIPAGLAEISSGDTLTVLVRGEQQRLPVLDIDEIDAGDDPLSRYLKIVVQRG